MQRSRACSGMRPGRRDALVLGGIALSALALGAVVGPFLVQANSGVPALLGTSFTDLSNNQPRRLAEWADRLLVCNFWATWCPPCIEEIPILIGVRQKHVGSGVEVVGIGIDQAAKMRNFAAKFNIPYPILIAGPEAIGLTKRLGNRAGGLPYTVVVDRHGRLAYQRIGAFRDGELEEVLAPILR